MECARLNRYGLLAVSGADARDFLHAQLTNDVAHLAPERSAFAGWCTAKGRLLATLLVIPAQDGFLLQLARDIAPAVAKRLSMFILRSKVKIADESDAWTQYGVWQKLPAVTWDGGAVSVPVGEQRHLRIGRGLALRCSRSEEDWTLE